MQNIFSIISASKPKQSKRSETGKIILILSFVFFLGEGLSASAQVIQDNTLPNNSKVDPNGNIIEITGGTTKGSNLFHSFKQFSVPTNNTAFFNNALDVENIIGRVTGGSVSNIDGIIRANGTANLFLINPNGIIFGPNASLNIGGSFIGSTANNLKFADGREFSATPSPDSSLLTLNVPVGLQYGSNAGNIVVQGNGNNISTNPDFSIDKSNRPVGVQVPDGQTLALIGGDVVLSGGNLTAAGGRVELWSVNDGLVSVVNRNGQLQVEAGQDLSYGDIQLFQAASVEASGNGGGNIQIQGRKVTVQDGSFVSTDTLGNGSGGNLTVRGTESVAVSGISSLSPIFSSLRADVEVGASGKGGNVVIETGRLQVTDGGQVSSGTFGDGNAGSLMVTAKDIQANGISPFGPSGLLTPVAPGARGDGGNLTIDTESLQVSDGAQILSTTFGFGDAGDLIIKADDIQVTGGTEFGPSAIDSSVFKIPLPEPLATFLGTGTGNGGNLMIETGSLRVADGAQIRVGTTGSGQAGNLEVNAQNIELFGFDEFSRSGLFANVDQGSGSGGNLNITTDRLEIGGGAAVSVSHFSSNTPLEPSKAGNIQINARFIELDSVSDAPSSITASTNVGIGGNVALQAQSVVARNNSKITAETLGSGSGGSIAINADRLDVENGAEVSVSSLGSGSAGNLNIAAETIALKEGSLRAEVEAGDRGNINLEASTIFLDQNSNITTNAMGTATGGNITIDTDFLIALNNSDITANAENSFGGRIAIAAEGIFGTEFREQLTPNSDITASSELGAEFSGVVEINSPEADAEAGAVELPETVTDPTKLIATGCAAQAGSAFVVTGRGGLPENPAQTLRGRAVWQDLRSLPGSDSYTKSPSETASYVDGETGGQGDGEKTQTRIVESQGWVINADGKVELVASAPEVNSKGSWQPLAQCGG